MVGRFPGKTVSILGEHHADAASRHQVSDSIEARTVDAGPALGLVPDLLEDLIAFASGAIPQGLQLLSQRVPAPCLLLGRHPSVEYRRLRLLILRVLHLSLRSLLPPERG